MIKPLKDHVQIEMIEEKERDGILLPEEIKSERCDCKLVKVIAVGPDVKEPIKPGDRCFLAPMKNQDIRTSEGDVTLCKEEELFARLEL